jgi:UDP-glucose 4-epimerase
LLGWHAEHGLDDIIASAWNWHSSHLDGYDSAPSP